MLQDVKMVIEELTVNIKIEFILWFGSITHQSIGKLMKFVNKSYNK